MRELLNVIFKGQSCSDANARLKMGSLCGWINVGFNLLLFLIKIFAAVISGSVSVAADALNNLSDMSSCVVGLVGFRFAGRGADTEHPYGHARAEYLSATAVAVLIILIGFELLKSGVELIFHPAEVDFSPTVAVVLTISVAVKLLMSLYNRRAGKVLSSELLAATADDARNDVLTTLGVFAGIVIGAVWGINLDGIIASLVSLFILASGAELIKSTIDPLLGAAPDPREVERIREKIMSYPSVIGAHDLMIHDYGPMRTFASVHVEMPAEMPALESHDIIDTIERDFAENDNIYMTIHLDPVVTGGETAHLRDKITQIAKDIHPNCTIHDLRIVPSASEVKIIFDCVKPEECNLTDDTVKDIFAFEIKKINPCYSVEVTFDSSFAPVQHF